MESLSSTLKFIISIYKNKMDEPNISMSVNSTLK